ncbi:MAG TPA: S41 family peptidase [Thermoanaerobaculaceae bacterium]|nr:S41 family peptidase [Thermoanaerobaculaceae bacterium]
MTARTHGLAAVVVLLLSAAWCTAAGTPAYIRYPDINGNRVVFAAEGDLWIASDTGGVARRLTTHPGTEYFPRFSPDGKWIAFTGEYDGNQDVFVIPAEGGEPRRLTWHPGPDQVVGWTPDGAKVLFRSRAENPQAWELFAVKIDGSDPEKLPVGWAARIDIDPDSGMWAFNRVTSEGRTWKRYRGGMASDIWVGRPEKADFRKVGDFDGPQEFPMWHGGRIYFLCDEGGTNNIWSMKPDGSDRRRHTDFKEWDARWPAMSRDGRIAFTLGADLEVFNAADDSVRKIDAEIPSDRILTRERYPEAARTLTWFDIAPKGDRVAIVTRGEAFAVPVKDGPTMPVTHGSGARESFASFSPDGKRLVYVTDAPGEDEIRSVDAWGRGEPRVVKPAGTSGYLFAPAWSPDGKLVAYADQTQTVYVVPADGGAPRVVDHSDQSPILDYVWSPDGRWLAYSKASRTDYSSVYIYDTKEADAHRVTGEFTNDYSPAWDPQGRYLYFLSTRATNPVLDSNDVNVIEAKNAQPFMVLLRKDVANPFAATKGLPDEATKDEKGKGEKAQAEEKKGEGKKPDGKEAKKEEKGEKPPEPVAIDFDGLDARYVELPNVDRGRYSNLAATAKFVYFLSNPLKGMEEQPGLFAEPEPDATLISYDVDKKKSKPFTEGVSAYAVALKGDKLAVMKKRGDIFVFDAGASAGDAGDAKLSLSGVVVELDPREEWSQIFNEAWRQERDFYWDAGMAGLDWKAIHDHYATLLPRLANRGDLSDLIGEMIGELNTSHTYVFGGDPGVHVTHLSTGLLGADVAREGDIYRVTRIYRGDPADNVRSPLDEPGVDVREGDFILAVNHRPFAKGKPFFAAFEDLAEKNVVLTVNSKPAPDGARDVVVQPLGNDRDLRYADWVRKNREYVAAKTGGKIGYIHLTNMQADGMTEFNTWYFPQLDKEGLVVDVRWNGGGFVSEIIVERLRRKVDAFGLARGGNRTTYPYRTLNGPFVVLTNQFAGSDGDIFPAVVQTEKLAPVIGMRSWGGVIGINGIRPLVDMGLLTEPEGAWNDPRRGWTIENHGVDPDIVVENLPQDVAKGTDAQLDRAITEVMKLHDTHPPLAPKLDPIRNRSREAFRKELSRP